MFLPRRFRLAAGLAVTAIAAVPAVGALAAGGHAKVPPRTHRQTAAAYSVLSSTTLAKGVHLTKYASRPDGRRAVSDVLTVALGQDGISAGVLAGAVTDTAPMQTWARSSHAVAAVNGDYFDISSSQAPNGSIVRNGRLLKGIRSGQSIVGQGRDGRMRVGTVYLDGAVKWGSHQSAPIDFFNTVVSKYSLPRNGIAVFDSEWGGAPLHLPGAKGLTILSVNSDHKVTKVAHKVKGQQVPARGMLIVASGSEAKTLGHLHKGDKVSWQVGMKTSAPASFAWGLGYGLTLMSHDQVVHNWPNDSDPRDARTAVGWKDGGRTMVAVTVEVGKGSAGEEVNQVADELAAQGATDGVLLDGGGSTTMVAHVRSQGIKQIGPVSNGGNVERHVPIGIGVFLTRHR